MSVRARLTYGQGFMAGLGISAALNAALWLYLASRLDGLAHVLPIHYNSAGQVDRLGSREQLFLLPGIGLLALLANGFLAVPLQRWDRQLPYLLAGVAIAVQLLVWGATLQLVH